MRPKNLSDAEAAYFKRFARWKMTVVLLILALGFTIIFATAIGSMRISPLNVYKAIFKNLPLLGGLVGGELSPVEETIIVQVRLPRVLSAAIIGIALAVSGTILQALLRNPMADPYVLGISAGASLGASLSIAFGIGLSFFGVLYSTPLMAFVTGVGTVYLVYNIAKTGRESPMLTLVLAGIAVNSFLLAIQAIIRIVCGEAIHALTNWLLGSLVTCNWNHVKIALPFTVIGMAATYVFARDLNIILLGEEQARNLGVDAEKLKKVMLASATLMTAGAVSISGIIGFVGLIIPHMARIMVGPDHRILIPTSALTGAILLILCDTIARSIIRPAELPVGIFTSILGCPFFIYLLRKRKRFVQVGG
ncbi:MAG: FecCD family ABC transporter permease [Candidatus Freyarchaeota archaeon]